MSNEGLDNLFKKELSGRNVEFNMASWQRMEEMLPPEKKPKGFILSATSLVVGALVLLGSTLIVLSATDIIFSSDQNNELVEEAILVDVDQANEAMIKKKALNEISLEQRSDLAENANTSTKLVNSLVVNPSVLKNDKQGNQLAVSSALPVKTNAYSALEVNDIDETSNSSVSKSSREYLSENLEEQVFGNLFTKILGIGELSSLLVSEQDDHTIIADVNNDKTMPKIKQNEFGFIGGVSFGKSLVNNSSSSTATGGMLGLTYQRYLNGGFSVKTNLLVSSRNGVNTQKLQDKKIYGFGSITEQSMVETQRLVYIEFPVMANYSMGNHNIIGGASFSYLVSCLNKVTTETTVQLEDPKYSEASEWGSALGFNPYDFSIIAGYEYNVKPNVNIGLRVNYGLLDVTKNSYFGTDSFDNNVQFRVYLTYSPFRF